MPKKPDKKNKNSKKEKKKKYVPPSMKRFTTLAGMTASELLLSRGITFAS